MGPDGLDGCNGTDGRAGAPGIPGAFGPRGPPGPVGDFGYPGEPGDGGINSVGAKGIRGNPGVDGPEVSAPTRIRYSIAELFKIVSALHRRGIPISESIDYSFSMRHQFGRQGGRIRRALSIKNEIN